MPEKAKVVPASNEEIAPGFNRADLEGYLACMFRSVSVPELRDLDLSNHIGHIQSILDELCQRACGREIARAVSWPFLEDMQKLLFWGSSWSLSDLISRLPWFWNGFNFPQNEADYDCLQLLNLADHLAEILDCLELMEDINVDLPGKNNGLVISGKVIEPDLITQKLAAILVRGDLKQSRNFEHMLSPELFKVYKALEKLFGFGKAFVTFSEVGSWPDAAYNLSLAQWEEIRKAAPEGTEIFRISQVNIELTLEERRRTQELKQAAKQE